MSGARDLPGDSTWLRRHAAHAPLLLVMLVLVPVCLGWSWSDRIGTLGADSIYYLTMARSYSPWHGYDAAAAHVAYAGHFPPLYPLVLGLAGASEHLPLASLINTLFLLSALTVLYGWLRQERQPAGPAAMVTLSVALWPGTWLLCLFPQSEFLYLLLSLATLWLIRRSEDDTTGRWLELATLTTAAAILTREIGVSLLPPLAVATFRQGGWRRLWLAAAAASPLLLHLVHRAEHSYVGQLGDYYAGDVLGQLIAQLVTEAAALHTGYLQNASLQGTATVAIIAGGILMLIAAALRIRRGCPDGLYVAAYFMIIMVWPFPSEADRLLWPILPVMAAQAWLGVAHLHPGPDRSRLLAACRLCLLLVLLIPGVQAARGIAQKWAAARTLPVAGVDRYVDWYRLDAGEATLSIQAQQSVLSGLESLRDKIPADACVVSMKPDWVAYLADRRSTPPPPPFLSGPVFLNQLASTGCRYVLGLAMRDPSIRQPLYPLDRLEGHFKRLDDGGFYIRSRDADGKEHIAKRTMYVLVQLF